MLSNKRQKKNLILLSLLQTIFIISVFSNNVQGINILILNDFSDFHQISDSSNIYSFNPSGNIYFEMQNNNTLDNLSEKYRFNLTRQYFDFNFSVGFNCNREKPLDIKFGVILESKYTENGTYLNGNYSKICETSLIGFTGEYRDLLYRVEFYPNGVYEKIQSAVFIFFMQTIEFSFSRINGSIKCLIKDGVGGYFHEKFSAIQNSGLNRSLDAIIIELTMNSDQCNSFSIGVNSISGELYDFIRESPKPIQPTIPPDISFDLSIAYICVFVAIFQIAFYYKMKKRKNTVF